MTTSSSRTTQTAPKRQATVLRFLEALAGPGTCGESLELRFRRSRGPWMAQIFQPSQRLHRMASRAVALGERADVYVGCAPRADVFVDGRRHGGRAAVRRAFVLWADCDGEDAVGALGQFEPKPSIVIASGTATNCHAYWPLVEPLPADEIERANRRLAHALGADPASADAARILRVPATYSHKHQPPVPVEAIRLDVARRLHAADIVGALADPPPAPRADPVLPDALRSDDPLLSIPPDVYVQRLLGVEVPRHRKVLCPFHADRHASLHVYKTAERGWYCFGRCRRGGTIYDLAALLYGYELRGDDFLRLRTELRRLFGLESS